MDTSEDETPVSLINGSNRFCTDKILQGLDMEMPVNQIQEEDDRRSEIVNPDVREKHQLMDKQIYDLGKQLSTILEKHEKDFLQAYKEQMIEVQEELKTLKIKIDDDSLRDKDNAKMTCLEHERDWFRAEAQRLDNISKDQTEKIKELKFKNKILIDDKNYYEGFVIETKKENKMIKKDIMRLYGQDAGQKQDVSSQNNYNRSHQQTTEFDDKKMVNKSNSQLSYKIQNQSEQEKTIEESNSKSMMEDKEKQQIEKLKALEVEIKRYQEKNGYFRHQKKGSLKQKIELEYILQSCQEEVKKDIYRKKMIYNKNSQLNNSKDIDFNRFSQNDKKRVVDMLMQNSRMIDLLYQIIFQHSKKIDMSQTQRSSWRKKKAYRGVNSSQQYNRRLPKIKNQSSLMKSNKSKKLFKMIKKH